MEVVFVDDASGDGTAEKAEALAAPLLGQAFRVHAMPENRGVFWARGEGVKIAVGRFVTFVDADDHWEDGYFEEMLDVLATTEVDVVLRPIRSRAPGAPAFGTVSGDFAAHAAKPLTPEKMMWALATEHLGFSGLWGRAMRRALAEAVWSAESAYPSYVDNDNNLLWRLYQLASAGILLLDGAAYVWDQHVDSTRYQPARRQGILQDKLLSICALWDWLRPAVDARLWEAIEAHWRTELRANLFDARSLDQTLSHPPTWSAFLVDLKRNYPTASLFALAALRDHFARPQFAQVHRLRRLHILTGLTDLASWPEMAARYQSRPEFTWWVVVPEDAPRPEALPPGAHLLLGSPGRSAEALANIALEHARDGHVLHWPEDAGWSPDQAYDAFARRVLDMATLETGGDSEITIWDRFLIGSDRWGKNANGNDLAWRLKPVSRCRLHVRR
jgi:glycosyltransferase involved in cell wall biosynthesis